MQVNESNPNANKQKERAVKAIIDFQTSKTMLLSYMASNELKQVSIAKLVNVKKQVINNFLKGKILKKSESQNRLTVWLLENNLLALKTVKPRAKCQCPDCGAVHIKKQTKGGIYA
jgi:predicted XRE-type DNA-binding protein